MDTSWSHLANFWERVRWARLQWQQRTGMEDTARAAAEALGVNEDTYTSWERPPRSRKEYLDVAIARKLGSKFKVNWVWLTGAEASPFDDGKPYSKETAEVADLIEQSPDDERPAVVAAIKTLLKRTGS